MHYYYSFVVAKSPNAEGVYRLHPINSITQFIVHRLAAVFCVCVFFFVIFFFVFARRIA